MDAKDLFLRNLHELYRCTNSQDQYEVLRVAQLIRQLFLDGGNSLAHKANATTKAKIRFRVCVPQRPQIPGVPEPDIWGEITGFYPRRYPSNLPIVEFNESNFLKMTIGRIDGVDYTVHNLIDYLAHIQGAVHLGQPKSDTEKAIQKFGRLSALVGFDLALESARAIGHVVLDAMSGLRDKLTGVKSFENAPGISCHVVAVIHRLDHSRENYIVEFGFKDSPERISLYVDSHDELCLRVTHGNSNYTVRAGLVQMICGFDNPFYVVLEAACVGNRLFISLNPGGWPVYTIEDVPGPLKLSDQIHLAIGSDSTGRQESHHTSRHICVYSRILTQEEKGKLQSYFSQEITKGGPGVILAGGAKMFTEGHPAHAARKTNDPKKNP